MTTRIRRATTEDAALIADFTHRMGEEVAERTGGDALSSERGTTAELCRDLLEKGLYTTFLAIDDASDKAVGIASLCETQALSAGGKLGVIQEFFVLPAYRSEDVGAALLEAVKDFGRSSGWRRIEVCTPPLPEFSPRLAFYERNGFAVTGGRQLQLPLK